MLQMAATVGSLLAGLDTLQAQNSGYVDF